MILLMTGTRSFSTTSSRGVVVNREETDNNDDDGLREYAFRDETLDDEASGDNEDEDDE
jgi:hypothetical protein